MKKSLRLTKSGKEMDTARTAKVTDRKSVLLHTMNIAQFGLCYLDRDLRYIHINDWLANINGLTAEEHLGRTIRELFPDIAEGVEGQLRQVIDTGKPIIKGSVYAETRAQPGVKRLFEHSYFPDKSTDGTVVGISCIVEDITESNRTQETLKEREQQFKFFAMSIGQCFWNWDIIAETVEIYSHSDLIFGYPRLEICNDLEWWSERIHEEDKKRVLKTYNDAATGKQSNCDYQYRFRLRDGSYSVVEDIIYFIRDATGKVVRSLGVMCDITERKQAERLHELAKFPDENPFPVLRVSREGVLVFANRSSWRLLKLWNCKINESIPEEWIKIVTFSLDNQEITEKTIRCEGLIYSLVISPFTSSGYVNIYGNDITELKKVEENERKLQTVLERAKRLEMAGTIAGQVAHDFNNLLAPMMAYPDFIREAIPRDNKAHSYLDTIEEAASKISEINQDLLTMGRRGHYNQVALNLNDIVQQALTELEPYCETLACDINLSDELMDILGGGAQLHRMISNLLHNAKDAMQKIGQITVKTENYYVDDVSGVYGRVPKGEYVKLTVSDTGCGIPDNIVQKIFDPFFTSKTTDKKRGTGLGMSVVDAVVKDHNGFIDLSTKVDEGTSFYIYLPITRQSRDSQDTTETFGGSEKILIVDDDPIQRGVSTVLLRQLGYTVNSVDNGEKAIEYLRENPHDLVVLDMVMPGGIDGTETYRQIVEVCPHQKAIILSGFSESDRVLEVQELGAGAFVRKPVSLAVISAAVRTELDRVIENVQTS